MTLGDFPVKSPCFCLVGNLTLVKLNISQTRNVQVHDERHDEYSPTFFGLLEEKSHKQKKANYTDEEFFVRMLMLQGAIIMTKDI